MSSELMNLYATPKLRTGKSIKGIRQHSFCHREHSEHPMLRAINGDDLEFELTADEIRAAHEEFMYPNYIASIESLGLNIRCLNSLNHYGIESITQLVQEINNGHTRYFRNLGAVSIRAACE